MTMEINGIKYVKADRCAETALAICASILLVENIGGGRVKLSLDDEPSMLLVIDEGSTGEFQLKRMREVEIIAN